MRIEEISRITGVAKHTLRYYEEEDVAIFPPNEDKNYRDYSDEDVAKVIQIVFLKNLGLKLKEIKTIFDSNQSPSEYYDEIIERLIRKKDEIDRQIAFIKYIKLMGIEPLISTMSVLAESNEKKLKDKKSRVTPDYLISKYMEWFMTEQNMNIFNNIPMDKAKKVAKALNKIMAKANAYRESGKPSESDEFYSILDELATLLIDNSDQGELNDKNIITAVRSFLYMKGGLKDSYEKKYPGIYDYMITEIEELNYQMEVTIVFEEIKKFVPFQDNDVTDKKVYDLTKDLFKSFCEIGLSQNIDYRKLVMAPDCLSFLKEIYYPLALEYEKYQPKATELAIKTFEKYMDEDGFYLQ